MKQPNYLSSESVEWYTPNYVLDLVEDVLGTIDLDPCANPAKTVPAMKHFTEEDDGINREWHGKIFMNPPYGATNSKNWCEKILKELSKNITEAIVLVGANVDTNYFNKYLAASDSCCLVQRRIQFISGSGNKDASSNTRSSVIFYYGENDQNFSDIFCKLGNIITLRQGYEGNHGLLAKPAI